MPMLFESDQPDLFAEKRAEAKRQRIEEAKVKMWEDPEWIRMAHLNEIPPDAPYRESAINGAAGLYSSLMPWPDRPVILPNGEKVEVNIRGIYLDEDWDGRTQRLMGEMYQGFLERREAR